MYEIIALNMLEYIYYFVTIFDLYKHDYFNI